MTDRLDLIYNIMLNRYLNFLCLLAVCSSIHIHTLTREMLEHLKRYPDYTNHFIFFHQDTLDTINVELDKWDDQADIRFYINDCNGNKLPECQNPQSTPLVLAYNRVLMKYNSDPNKLQDMKEWIESRIIKNTYLINHEHELVKLLEQKPNIFCFCSNTKLSDDESVFFALAKSIPFQNYCIIRNQIFYTELGLKPGNVTFFKNSTTNREEFIHANRIDAWEWFVKSNMFHTIPRVNQITAERFVQKQNKSIKAIVLTCDLSFTCEKIWQRINELEGELSNSSLGFNFHLALQDKQESFSFNLYYHLSFDMRKFPALVSLDLKSQSAGSGDLLRYIHYPGSDFSIKQLKQFTKLVEDKKIEPFYFSGQIPKLKNGFTGKGSQKFIQKVVAKNVKEVLSTSPNHYLLLVTALDVGCTKCEDFYRQYKQVASLLIETDLTFGYLNANKNEIMIQEVAQLPDLLLYKKDDKNHPIRLDINHSFDHLRNFIRDNLGDKYFNPDQL